jgi:hypothetical protein
MRLCSPPCDVTQILSPCSGGAVASTLEHTESRSSCSKPTLGVSFSFGAAQRSELSCRAGHAPSLRSPTSVATLSTPAKLHDSPVSSSEMLGGPHYRFTFAHPTPLILANWVISRQKWMHQNHTTSRDCCKTSITARPSPASRSNPTSSNHVAPCDTITGM